MIKKSRNLLIITTVLFPILFFSQNVSSQSSKIPKWVTKAPVEKNTFIGIGHVVKNGGNQQKGNLKEISPFDINVVDSVASEYVNYNDSAKYNALQELVRKLPWNIEKESLLYELADRGIKVPNIEETLVKIMYDAPEFIKRGTWENDAECWCFYSITSVSFKAFVDRITEDLFNKAESLYLKGCANLQEGFPVKAASCYINALNTIQPLVFKCFPYEGEEFGRLLLESTLSVYDGITIEPQYDSVPAVFGESVPFDIKVYVKQNGLMLPNIAVYSIFKGESESATSTDACGVSNMKVIKVLDKEAVQTITFGIDKDVMFNVGTSLVDNLFRNQEFQETQVKLLLFNPIISVKVEMSPFDSTLVGAVSDAITSYRKDMKLTSDSENADITVKIVQETKLENEIANDRYSIKTFSNTLSLDAILNSDNSILKHYDIQDYKYTTKGARGTESVYHSVARYFSHMLKDLLPEILKGVEYDKRSAVWEKYL